ncbi:hypothetical protein BU24DRAFT_283411 [Aaosphaeria arxii CBS 175.79]|uniref:CFEM domain-containing protein n=1 Tax=Aaosphaeria arxii CBS 175.79 TaxID=1450172 RepID=A0A6A5XFA1_9PLEO|nr:uncharacterized protein BU24DRAFT_283411 [Aaosphaeria arxii CBS 175.79]KAF2011539.1 hypothetical protein BU24DRAFT_283411 [Aaosphaeria arxii CBS 175.79]
MLLSHFKRLCTLFPTLIASTTPQSSVLNTSSPSPLPSPIQRAVPACAQPCVQASLLARFPLACTSPFNLNCLCSRYSIAGEALGEVALGCIYSSCPTVDSQAASAYAICLGQKDAVVPTQSALTIVATSTIPSTSSITGLPTTIATQTLSTPTTRPSSIPPSGVVDTDSVSSMPPASSPTQTAAESQVQSQSPRTMKPAQIAGLAVAAAAVFILAIGLMALSIFLRRRRERKNDGDGLEKGSGQSEGGPSPFAGYVPHTPAPIQSSYPPRSMPQDNRRPWTNPRKNQRTHQEGFTNANPSRPRPQRKNADQNLQLYAMQTLPNTDRRPPTKPSLNKPFPKINTNHNFSSNRVDSPQSLSSAAPIGVAISAELPADSVFSNSSRARQEPASGQAVSTLKAPEVASRRPDSTLTQHTVFEEDEEAIRRRSSILLPTPPMPVPPIRSLQPSRPHVSPASSSSSRQPGLSLNIPVRHSISNIERIVPAKIKSNTHLPSPPPAIIPLAPPIRLSPVRDRSVSGTTGRSTRSNSSNNDVPDYYFGDVSPRRATPNASPAPSTISRGKQPVKTSSNLRPKTSMSTVSRATSRASLSHRDSMSSQTSFESIDGNDPTPEEDDEDDNYNKQLASDSKLSPVAESPISNLRYPKVPRASNQLVPRSPRSPKSPHSLQSLDSPRRSTPLVLNSVGSGNNPSTATTIIKEPSALLVKRRGEGEALNLGRQLQMDSPKRTEVRNYMRGYRRQLRNSSVQESWSAASKAIDDDDLHPRGRTAARVQSGQWPKSPAMYDADAVQPFHANRARDQNYPRQHAHAAAVADAATAALKSPLWVPRLTPTRKGDDLFIAVSYSKKAGDGASQQPSQQQ